MSDNDDQKAQPQQDSLAPLVTSPTRSEASVITVVNTRDEPKMTDMSELSAAMNEIGVAENSSASAVEKTSEHAEALTVADSSIAQAEAEILAAIYPGQADHDEDSDAAPTATTSGFTMDIFTSNLAGAHSLQALDSESTIAKESDKDVASPPVYKSIFGGTRNKAVAGPSSNMAIRDGARMKIYDVKNPAGSSSSKTSPGHYSVEQAYNDQDAAGPSSSMSSSGVTDAPAMSAKAKGKQPATMMNHNAGFTVNDGQDYAPDNAGNMDHGIVDVDGKPATDDTHPENFKDWIKYLVFCEHGKLVCCQFGTVGENGDVRVEKKLYVPKKLLCDFSSVMKRMLSGPWVEAQTSTMTLDDIDANDFYRLIQIIKAGFEGSQINLGKQENLLSNLFKTYILADRYLMVEVKFWIMRSITEHIARLSNGWSAAFNREVTMGHGSTRTAELHRAQMRDICEVYDIIACMDESQTPVQLSDLVNFIVFHCPRPLVVQMWGEMSNELINEIGYRLASSST